MQYEDIIYKAGILAMAVRLEGFLKAEWELRTGRKPGQIARAEDGDCPTKRKLVKEFLDGRKLANAKMVQGAMWSLFDRRDELAHPSDRNIRGEDFERIREGCRKVDAELGQLKPQPKSPLPRMGEVMISCSLRYDMGNAGDIIKHGVLAEFAEWWAQSRPRDPLCCADPFGGRPWGVAKDEVRTRLGKFKNFECALLRAQQKDNPKLEKYYGSSHVILNAADSESTTVYVSDADMLARNDLQAAGWIRDKSRRLQSKLKLIEGGQFADYNPRNGYSILDYAKDFGFILIDPYADFLRDELAAEAGSDSAENGRFCKMNEAMKRDSNLWIATFVLIGGGESSDKYEKLRENSFGGRFIALRCPPLREILGRKNLAGESDYSAEILLVSSQLSNDSPDIAELRQRIGKFKRATEKALGAKDAKLVAWGLGE